MNLTLINQLWDLGYRLTSSYSHDTMAALQTHINEYHTGIKDEIRLLYLQNNGYGEESQGNDGTRVIVFQLASAPKICIEIQHYTDSYGDNPQVEGIHFASTEEILSKYNIPETELPIPITAMI